MRSSIRANYQRSKVRTVGQVRPFGGRHRFSRRPNRGPDRLDQQTERASEGSQERSPQPSRVISADRAAPPLAELLTAQGSGSLPQTDQRTRLAPLTITSSW